MSRSTWTPRRARVFARGLYEVAACDGVDPLEARAIQGFLAKAGLPTDLETLAREPFDVVEATEVLDSVWLRRVFIQACEMMSRVDGGISSEERDIMRALAAGLGVGRRHAQNPALGSQPQPDDLAAWVAERAVDFVSWDDESQPGYFWAFPHADNPIELGARLEVAPSQAAVFHIGGDVTDTLPTGDHDITPASLPGLATRAGWRDGPVSAEVAFVSTSRSDVWRWGTNHPIVVEDARFGTLALRAFGRFSVAIGDPERAFVRFARRGIPTPDEFQGRLRRIVAGRFGEGLGRLVEVDRGEVGPLLRNLVALTQRVRPHLDSTLGEAGLEIGRFFVENISGPMSLERAMAQAPDANFEDSMSPCHGCQSPVSPGARFCAHCGTAQRAPSQACVQCQNQLAARAKFCPACGARQPGA